MAGALTYCKKPAQQVAGSVLFVKGQASATIAGQSQPARVGLKLAQGDKIETGKDGIVIIKLDGIGNAEVQFNTSFQLTNLSPDQKELGVPRGNMWLNVNRLTKGQKLRVRTPTSVAGVRGTRFFTFRAMGFTGTCHCEGEVEFENTNGDYKGTHYKHNLVFMKNGKTVVMNEDDFKKLGLPIRDTHTHSMLDDSPVGPREIPLTEKQMQALGGFLQKKFKS